jgi:hypothetical protein
LRRLFLLCLLLLLRARGAEWWTSHLATLTRAAATRDRNLMPPQR